MQRIPFIIFLVAIVVTIPTMIILLPYETPNANGEELNVEINPKCGSTNKILCEKLDHILHNQELIKEQLAEIYDLNS